MMILLGGFAKNNGYLKIYALIMLVIILCVQKWLLL
jgi:hypothetical protein